MQYFPLFVDTQSLKILIVGAGDVASRKLDLLCRTEAEVHVIALELNAEVIAYQQQGRITLEQRPVSEYDIESWDLVYLATADRSLNEMLANVAKQRNIWVNVVDNPSFCRFITPSIVDRGRLQIAISTAGAAPVYARELRARLESWLPQSITPLFDFIAEHRQDVQTRLPIFKQRRLFWQRFFKLNQSRFDENTTAHYQASFSQQDGQGELLLLDPNIDAELLPIAAMPYLQKLDIVFSKHSIPHSLNELLRRDAARDSNWSVNSLEQALNAGEHCLVCADVAEVKRLAILFPGAKRFQVGAV
ncbi:bifunctional precorrin-2 dehydrogenase/sirohydrochlorin ferrochelatase [Shewanella sp. KX20019]|uniref:precorrin-2 dehydrogenase/sirohydrochlorin ferrochelatase family protein n=1 Tax=Shewanella sp. KX20019 TaxID=2803864 RepID=UPI0019297B78|nr:bifunctional precorrin-2 dehydrogenase/sirohydrochlorin ferrochelatase [Shewanella sp. KX20019]QQX81886.1 bifunctional precorrin-2 dehydrogenase/sirohydrochlorin ferrochelatase [Shewanella sp. KX20019]